MLTTSAILWDLNYRYSQEEKTTLSKILCKWKQDSVVIFLLYLDSVFKNTDLLTPSKLRCRGFVKNSKFHTGKFCFGSV